MMQTVVGYLQNEIDVLRAVNSAEARANLQIAQQKFQLAETMQGNIFSLLQSLKQDPNYIRNMIELPYNTLGYFNPGFLAPTFLGTPLSE